MRRLLGIGIVAVTLALMMGVLGAAAASAMAQEEADIPQPEECRVEPRSVESLLALAQQTPAGTGATEPAEEEASEPAFTPPAGETADEETVEAVTASIREFIACFNAGDHPRLLALMTDRYLVESFGLDEETANSYLTPLPMSSEDFVAMPTLSAMTLLEDGRVGLYSANAEDAAAAEAGEDEATADYVILAQSEDGERWLLDEDFEDVPAPAED